ncbi:MAG: hypothetical protein ACI9ES_001784 [Oceanospirillaceae bacterium]|jgi:hypothetical protein
MLGISEQLYIAKKPLYKFQRHIMVTAKLPKLNSALNKIIENLDTNQTWQAILSKYNLSTLAVP